MMATPTITPRPGYLALKGVKWHNNQIVSPAHSEFIWSREGILEADKDPGTYHNGGINATWNLRILYEYAGEPESVVLVVKTAGKVVVWKNGVVRSRQAIVVGTVMWKDVNVCGVVDDGQDIPIGEEYRQLYDIELNARNWQSKPKPEIPFEQWRYQPPAFNGEPWMVNTKAAAMYFNRPVFTMDVALKAICNQRKFMIEWMAQEAARKEEEKAKEEMYAQLFGPRKPAEPNKP